MLKRKKIEIKFYIGYCCLKIGNSTIIVIIANKLTKIWENTATEMFR